MESCNRKVVWSIRPAHEAHSARIRRRGIGVINGGRRLPGYSSELRKLGSGTVEAGGSKTQGAAVSAVVTGASGNPVRLIVISGMKVYGEASGSAKVEGRATATVQEISDHLKVIFQQQGWIS
jgi:hypothetical protein